MPGYSIVVLLHLVAGMLALVTFWYAAALRKGSPGHRLAGRAYLLAMTAIIVTGVPLAIQRALLGHPVSAMFLGYLLVIVGTTVWLAWRAIRDRHDARRYLGRAYRVLAIANSAAGLLVLVVGLRVGQPLLVGFAFIGLTAGVGMWRRRRIVPARPRWWMEEHYRAMTANGAATHVAFLAIGLPRLLPGLADTALFYAAWFAPVILAFAARVWLDRRYGAGGRPPVKSPALPVAQVAVAREHR